MFNEGIRALLSADNSLRPRNFGRRQCYEFPGMVSDLTAQIKELDPGQLLWVPAAPVCLCEFLELSLAL